MSKNTKTFVPRLPLLDELSSCSKAPLLFERAFLHEGPEEEEDDKAFFTTHSLKRRNRDAFSVRS